LILFMEDGLGVVDFPVEGKSNRCVRWDLFEIREQALNCYHSFFLLSEIFWTKPIHIQFSENPIFVDALMGTIRRVAPVYMRVLVG
ncbi:MAG: hypothetical protein ACKPEQ_26510, partial [Dolichospermum sp.]